MPTDDHCRIHGHGLNKSLQFLLNVLIRRLVLQHLDHQRPGRVPSTFPIPMKPNICCIGCALALVAALLGGCNTIDKVKDEVGKGGFALVYPAQSGIEPGQIWRADLAFIDQRRPTALKDGPSGPAQFESLSKTVDASAALDADFGDKVVTDIGKFSAGLKAARVKKVDLNFGQVSIKRIVVGDLRDENILKDLPQTYKNALSRVEHGEGNLAVITAVLYVQGMKYTFTCDDTTSLQASIPELKQLVKGDFKLQVVSKTQAVWEVPSNEVLAIGVSPLEGGEFVLTGAYSDGKFHTTDEFHATDETAPGVRRMLEKAKRARLESIQSHL